MREYNNVLHMIEVECSAVLSVLSESDKEILFSALDYEPIVLRVSGGIVSTVDSIDSTIYGTETMQEFISSALQWLSEKRQYFN